MPIFAMSFSMGSGAQNMTVHCVMWKGQDLFLLLHFSMAISRYTISLDDLRLHVCTVICKLLVHVHPVVNFVLC